MAFALGAVGADGRAASALPLPVSAVAVVPIAEELVPGAGIADLTLAFTLTLEAGTSLTVRPSALAGALLALAGLVAAALAAGDVVPDAELFGAGPGFALAFTSEAGISLTVRPSALAGVVFALAAGLSFAARLFAPDFADSGPDADFATTASLTIRGTLSGFGPVLDLVASI